MLRITTNVLAKQLLKKELPSIEMRKITEGSSQIEEWVRNLVLNTRLKNLLDYKVYMLSRKLNM